MTTYPLPDAPKVRAMLGLLFDGLDVKAGRKFESGPASGAWAGLYVAQDGRPVALCVCDAALAAGASAALSMLPPGVAKDAAKNRQLTDVMVANLQEIMNICSRLLMNDASPHLKLASLHPAKELPPPVAALLAGAHGRVDFELNVPKYGPGLLGVLAT